MRAGIDSRCASTILVLMRMDMDSEKLNSALEPWIRLETWHTFHPTDGERFHRAVRAAIESVGPSITKENFEDAILELAKKYHPSVLASQCTEDSDYWSQRAGHIASFVRDIGGL